VNCRRNRLHILIFILCVLLYANAAQSQDETIPNTELLHKVIENSILQLEEVLPPNADISLDVKFPEYDWFVRHRSIEVLNSLGYSVGGNNENDQNEFYIVEMGVEQIGIRYDDVRRRSLFRSRIMTRSADAVFSFRIIGGGKDRVVRVSESISDEIAYSRHREVENPALPFTQAPLPGGSLTERFLGPAVIVAATGVVVYLFFSVRS